MMQRWTSQAIALSRTNWKRADLEFEGVEHDGASFVVHVFLNNPDADDTTPRTAEERYAGYLTVFAHGDCWGDVGHCDIPEPVSEFDRRPPHPLTPFNATLEITDALSALPADTSEITVTALAFNRHGDDAGVLRFKELTLLTYELVAGARFRTKLRSPDRLARSGSRISRSSSSLIRAACARASAVCWAVISVSPTTGYDRAVASDGRDRRFNADHRGRTG